jgi:hypothetical protein
VRQISTTLEKIVCPSNDTLIELAPRVIADELTDEDIAIVEEAAR